MRLTCVSCKCNELRYLDFSHVTNIELYAIATLWAYIIANACVLIEIILGFRLTGGHVVLVLD